MRCQHDFKLRAIGSVYTCTKCDMDLSVELYEMYQQARKEGWEQAKREAESIACNISSCADDCYGSQVIADAIADMEYRRG